MASPTDGGPRETSTSRGWRNQYVREGFDVDGAESRLHPLGMERRIRLAQAQYEVWSGALGDIRVFYPAIRLLCALLGRERAAEQWIAETEYVIHHGGAINRGGPGTRRWWLGITYFAVVLTGTFAVGIALAAGLVVWVPRLLTVVPGISTGAAQFWTALALVLVGTVGLAWLLIRTARTMDD